MASIGFPLYKIRWESLLVSYTCFLGLVSFTSFAFISTASKVSGRMAGEIRLTHETNNISQTTEVPTDRIPLLNEQFESRGKLTSAISLYFYNQDASVKLDKRRSGVETE